MSRQLTLDDATALYEQGRVLDAREALTTLVAAAPEDVDARFGLALVHGELGDEEAAERELRAVLSLAPEHPRAHLQLGLLRERTGRPDLAVAHLERAAQDPGLHLARQALARLQGAPAAVAPATAAAGPRRPEHLRGPYVLGIVDQVDTVQEAADMVGAAHAGAMARAMRTRMTFRIRTADGRRHTVTLNGVRFSGGTPRTGEWVAVPDRRRDGRFEVTAFENLETHELVRAEQPSRAGQAGYNALVVFVTLVIVAAFAWVGYGFVTTQL